MCHTPLFFATFNQDMNTLGHRAENFFQWQYSSARVLPIEHLCDPDGFRLLIPINPSQQVSISTQNKTE